MVLVYPDKVGSADVRFPVGNVGAHNLPALVMGVLTGRVAESATCEISTGQLADAGAGRGGQHVPPPQPGGLEGDSGGAEGAPDGRVFVVFIDTFHTPATSAYDEALRTQIAQGQRAALYA